MKKYEAPMLFVDQFAADTMIASTTAEPKNANAGNNQNCWGCKTVAGELDPGNPENSCFYTPDNPQVYAAMC